MKTKGIILLALTGVALFLSGYFIGRRGTGPTDGDGAVERVTGTQTIEYRRPVPQMEAALDKRIYTIPSHRIISGGVVKAPHDSLTADTSQAGEGAGVLPRSSDSAIIELPQIQRHYSDSTYEAWVSGPLDPRLDSIRVFAPTTIITRHKRDAPKRWHLGVTAGYGYGPRGFQPYVGAGITFSIISF